MAKGICIGADNFTKRTLPSGYTQVEYIGSDGNQYINLDFIPNQDTRIITDAYFPKTSSTTSQYLYGSRSTSSTTTAADMFCFYTNGGLYKQGYNDSFLGLSGGTGDGRITIDHNKNVVTVSNGDTNTGTYASFSCGYPLYVFTTNAAGSTYSSATARIYSMKVYDNGVLVRDCVPCTNSSGTAGLYDLVEASFYANAGTGTFTVGNTYSSVARKVKKLYVGVDGVARKIKKGYVGVGGVARPFMGDELMYYGTITSLSTARYDLGATHVGDYALFGGGRTGAMAPSNVVDAYNSSLTRSTATTLSAKRYRLAGGHVGNYALFSGGSGTLLNSAVVNAYDTSLTRSNATSGASMSDFSGACTSNHAIFGPRQQYSGGSTSSGKAAAYDSSLTKSDISPTSISYEAGTHIGDLAIFQLAYYHMTGGTNNGLILIDNDLTYTNSQASTGLSARIYSAATTTGSYALFAGGQSFLTADSYLYYGVTQTDVIAVDENLTVTIAPSLTEGRCFMGATHIGEFAIFAGGGMSSHSSSSQSYSASSSVDVYDSSLTKTMQGTINTAKYGLVATHIGKYAIFGGGVGSANSAVVEAYTV